MPEIQWPPKQPSALEDFASGHSQLAAPSSPARFSLAHRSYHSAVDMPSNRDRMSLRAEAVQKRPTDDPPHPDHPSEGELKPPRADDRSCIRDIAVLCGQPFAPA